MTKFMKTQIIWASVVFVLVLIIGYLGIFALQKSMTIKMSFNSLPNIRCVIEAQIDGGEYEDIFSNLSTNSFISPNWTINEANSELVYRNSLINSIGSTINFRIHNYTDKHIFAESIVSGVKYDSKVIDALANPTATASVQVVEAVILSTSLALQFTQVYKVEPTFTNVEFDMDNYLNNTLQELDNVYFIPIGEDLKAKLVSTYNNLAPVNFSYISINDEQATLNEDYTYSNNILTIPAGNLGDVQISSVYYAVNVNLYEGIDDTSPTTIPHHNYGFEQTFTITATEYHSVPSQVNITTGNASSFGYEPIIEYNASNVATSVWNQAQLTITPTSNCTINVYLNPWTYGQYVATDEITDTPSIWAGYYYLQFENSRDKWIIIGESENIYSNYSNQINPEPTNSGLLNTGTYEDEDENTVRICPALNDETTSIQVKTYTSAGGDYCSPNIKPKTRMFQELTGNQVLLYKETTVLDKAPFNTTSGTIVNKWGASTLKTVLNGTYYTTTQNLDEYESYISNTILYTVHTETGTTMFGESYAQYRKLTQSQEKIFVLSTLSGNTNDDGNGYPLLSTDGGPSGTGLGITVTAPCWATDNTYVYINQNFNIEMYLGGYDALLPATNKKMYYYSEDNAHNWNTNDPGREYNADYIWLRSGCADHKGHAFHITFNGRPVNGSMSRTDMGARPAFVLDLAKNYVPVT